MPAHIRQRLADNLRHDLAVMRGEHVLGSIVRQLDPDAIKTRELFSLAPQVPEEPVRTDRGRSQVGKRLTDAGQRPLEDLEDIHEGLVAMAFTFLEIDLEKRDRAGQLGGDSVMQLAGDARTFARHSIVSGLLGKGLGPRAGPGALPGHRVILRRA